MCSSDKTPYNIHVRIGHFLIWETLDNKIFRPKTVWQDYYSLETAPNYCCFASQMYYLSELLCTTSACTLNLETNEPLRSLKLIKPPVPFHVCLNIVLNVIALVSAFNQKKAFSVIVKSYLHQPLFPALQPTHSSRLSVNYSDNGHMSSVDWFMEI